MNKEKENNKVWVPTLDSRVRLSHADLNSQMNLDSIEKFIESIALNKKQITWSVKMM